MIEIYADGASLEGINEARNNPLVKGFTTNPTLMRQARVTNYEFFARDVLNLVDGMPVSFEVFSDEFDDMERQARKIASWGKNVSVKIPITNTKGESSAPLIKKLSSDGISCNVTAVFTLYQVLDALEALNPSVPAIISVFAGRIADTGVDPMPITNEAVRLARKMPLVKILWASPREVLNIKQAETAGCHIITVPPDMLKKYTQCNNKGLALFSLETVKMFYDDATKSGYQL